MTTYAMPAPLRWVDLALALSASRHPTVDLTADTLAVRLGRTWHAEIPRGDITSAAHDPSRTLSVGAHGWRGDWLVNTSVRGIVVLAVDPAARARCLGVPVRVRRLRLSLADPDAFLADLGAPPG